MIRYYLTITCLLILMCMSGLAVAQDSTIYRDHKGGGRSPVTNAAKSLKKSLSGDDREQTASQYELLAKELSEKGEYAKAEEYMKKALEIYTSLDRKAAASKAGRALAKIQEAQNKIIPAINSYRSAGTITEDKKVELINLNDANRLQYISNPRAQADYVQSNIDIFEKEGKREEAADAYKNLAKSQLLQNNAKEAVASYEKAIEKSNTTQAIADISKKISKVYAADNQIGKAISMNEGILATARAAKDLELQIDQAGELAQLYDRNHEPAKAMALLEETYALAFRSGNTAKTKTTLLALASHYKRQHNESGALARYEDFLHNLDTLLKTDSSLVDATLFEITEGRIKELERERFLQYELINRKNTFSYFLIGSVAAMLLLLLLIVRSFYAIKAKNKRIALQSLRREMNPHFIFNSLNSVNQYIAENNELAANKYLTAYSGLMRNVMEHSHKDFVTLSVELDQLKKYLEMEHLRFADKFDYRVRIDESLDADALLVPNMLIQPHLENAVWHGLRYKTDKGLLQLDIARLDNWLRVTITDDGIGLTKSKALKTVNQKVYQSRGITNTTERINLLNELYKTTIQLNMEEITADGKSGTKVTLLLPIMHKK